MKKSLPIVILGLSSALSADANAVGIQHYWHHTGQDCVPKQAFRNDVDYSQWGIHNTSTTTTVTVECPLSTAFTVGATSRIVTVDATIFDRSTTAGVVCTLRETGVDGTISYSYGLATGVAAGGPGSGALGLHWDLPANYIFSSRWSLVCTLPPMESGWQSHLVSTMIIETLVDAQ
jgi:hypothetical protein